MPANLDPVPLTAAVSAPHTQLPRATLDQILFQQATTHHTPAQIAAAHNLDLPSYETYLAQPHIQTLLARIAAEEQRRLRARAISRELRALADLINDCRAMCEAGPDLSTLANIRLAQRALRAATLILSPLAFLAHLVRIFHPTPAFPPSPRASGERWPRAARSERGFPTYRASEAQAPPGPTHPAALSSSPGKSPKGSSEVAAGGAKRTERQARTTAPALQHDPERTLKAPGAPARPPTRPGARAPPRPTHLRSANSPRRARCRAPRSRRPPALYAPADFTPIRETP